MILTAETVEAIARSIAGEVIEKLRPAIVRAVVAYIGPLVPDVQAEYDPNSKSARMALVSAVAPATELALPSVSGKRCQKCGEVGHYGNNHAFHPTAGKPAKRMARDDDRDAAPPEVRRLKPTPAALEAAERRRIAREATPVNPRGTLPEPISSWEF